VVASRLCVWLVMGAAELYLEAAKTRLLVARAVSWSVSAAAMWGRGQGATVPLTISYRTETIERKRHAHVYAIYLTFSEGHSD